MFANDNIVLICSYAAPIQHASVCDWDHRKTPFLRIVFGLCCLLGLTDLKGGCLDATCEAELFERSQAVAKVEVIIRESFIDSDDTIATRYQLRRIENYKGEVPTEFEIISAGGKLEHECHLRSDFLDLQPNQKYALMLHQDEQGRWTAPGMMALNAPDGCEQTCQYLHNGACGSRPQHATVAATTADVGFDTANSGVPSSRVTTTGYLETNLQPTRFIACDGNEPIRYIVDVNASQLPSGMNVNAALAVVREALNVWSSVSSLRFVYDGTESFSSAASSISVNDRRLRIQLHDPYGAVNGSVLGIGGGFFRAEPSSHTGGTINGQAFQERLSGYVVIENVTIQTSLQNADKFKHVLTHELGHALGLAHSSEDPNEADTTLKNATMYYMATNSGAVINAYDSDRIQFGYPATQTPPTAINRVISAITTHSFYGSLPTNVLGVNRIRLRSYDRQGDVASATIVGQHSSNPDAGTFSIDGNDLVFTPSGFYYANRYSDTEIEQGYYRDYADVVFSDGINQSRPIRYTVIALNQDTTPSDGLPDNWMTEHFETTAPGTIGSNRHPDSDPDGDGLSNRLEFCLNTDPNNPQSGPVAISFVAGSRKLNFRPQRFAPYFIESSNNLQAGSWALSRISATDQDATDISVDFSLDPVGTMRFFRVGTDF